MADKPNVDAAPVEARPNHIREKTYQEPNAPQPYKDELRQLPEKTAQQNIREDMSEATAKVKAKVKDASS
jgi:hypothetical protein